MWAGLFFQCRDGYKAEESHLFSIDGGAPDAEILVQEGMPWFHARLDDRWETVGQGWPWWGSSANINPPRYSKQQNNFDNVIWAINQHEDNFWFSITVSLLCTTDSFLPCHVCSDPDNSIYLYYYIACMIANEICLLTMTDTCQINLRNQNQSQNQNPPTYYCNHFMYHTFPLHLPLYLCILNLWVF